MHKHYLIQNRSLCLRVGTKININLYARGAGFLYEDITNSYSNNTEKQRSKRIPPPEARVLYISDVNTSITYRQAKKPNDNKIEIQFGVAAK